MENPELYGQYNTLPKRDVTHCLNEYGDRIRWRGRDRVIDLGCGDGGITAGVLRAFLPRDFAQLVGCDVSARMVKHARANYEDERTSFCEVDLGVPLPQDMKGSFDHAFSFYAIHWVRDQKIRWRGRDRVIDLGCGDGGITAGVLRAFLPSDFAQLVGCDVSARMVKHARAYYEDERTSFCEVDLGVPLPQDMKGSFDHAFSFYAIHWVQDQKQVFTNIYEMLAPGGDCLLMFMTRQPIVEMFRMVGSQTEWRTRMRLPDMRFLVYHDSQKPQEEVRTLMENAGFKDIMIEWKVVKYTFESLEKYIGAMLSISPFEIPEELREEYVRAHMQAVRDLRLPTYRIEEGDAPGKGQMHQEYGVIIASGRK